MKNNTFTPLRKWSAPTLLAISFVACGVESPSTSSSSESSANNTSSVSSESSVSSQPPQSSSQSSSSSVPSDLPLVVAINAGSDTATTLDGIDYQADKYSNGGQQNSTPDPISGVVNGVLYQSERYGTYSYQIPVLQGTYTITVHMAELYNNGAGERTFDLLVEENVEINDLDLYAMVGHDGAYTYTIENVPVSDGTLDIAVNPSQDNGTLSGFAVYSADGGIDPNPPAPPEPPETDWPTWENCNGYVGITYDDGPTNTDAWVSALNNAGLAPVTWFVQGNNTNSLPADIPKLMTTGYIQNHSYDHQDMGSWSYDQARSNLQRANDAITNAGAPAPTIFRPPYGSTGNGLRQAANDLGMIVLLWDVDSQDWNNASAGSIASSAGQLRDGQVILMHQNQNASRQAIPQVVQSLKNNGMCPGALDPNTGRAVAPY